MASFLVPTSLGITGSRQERRHGLGLINDFAAYDCKDAVSGGVIDTANIWSDTPVASWPSARLRFGLTLSSSVSSPLCGFAQQSLRLGCCSGAQVRSSLCSRQVPSGRRLNISS